MDKHVDHYLENYNDGNLIKMNQIINKICHRSKATDDDTSAVLEDNPNIPPKKQKKQITLLQKRLLWCVAGIVFLFAGYLLWRMPAKMRVVAVFPGDAYHEFEGDNHVLSEFTPIGLYYWNKPENPNDISKLTLYSWDGKECWSKQLNEKYNDMNMVCSNDGHYVAVCIKEKNKVIVFNWHDGNFSGKVSFFTNGIDGLSFIIDNFWITNSGRVWLYYYNSPSSYTIKAIDGTHVASGNMPLRYFKEAGELHPNPLNFYTKEEVIAEYRDKGIQYWKLKVIDNKVLIQYSKLQKVNKDKYPINDNLTTSVLPGTNGNVIYTEFFLDKLEEKKEFNFSYLPTGQKWNIISPKDLKMEPVYGTKDGKYILSANFNLSPDFFLIYDYLSKFITIDRYDFMTGSQLAIYNNNGVKVAEFPIRLDMDCLGYFNYLGDEYSISSDIVLSPDGKRVGIKCSENDGYNTGTIILGW